MRGAAVCCLALWLYLPLASAASLESVSVDHADGRYSVNMTVRLGVSAPAAYAVMNDASALPEVNHDVTLAEKLPDQGLHTVVHMCIAFFCRSIEQYQTVHRNPPENLRMQVLPEHSDFSFGRAQWHFQALTPGTSRLKFDAELEPKFWIPPLIGPWLVQRKLEEQARVTSNGIERVARERGY